MKNYIPLFLSLSTLIGLLTLIASSNYLFNSIALSQPTEENVLIIGKDTLSASPILNNLPKLRNGNDLKRDKVDNGNEKEKMFYLNIFPATLNWIVFHSTALSIGTASIIFILFLIRKLKNRFEIKFRSKEVLKAIGPLILVLVIVAVFFVSITDRERSNYLVTGAEIMEHFNIVFRNPNMVVDSVVNAFFIIGLVPFIGIMMVNIAISKLRNNELDNEFEFTAKYKEIKDSLNIFALYAGLLVAVTIVGTRLQRNMIAEHISGIAIENNIYPDEFIFAYGGAFTLILALFFLPSLVYLKYSRTKESTTDKNEAKNLSWWKIGEESINDIKLIFSLVLPLISSIVQSFL